MSKNFKDLRADLIDRVGEERVLAAEQPERDLYATRRGRIRMFIRQEPEFCLWVAVLLGLAALGVGLIVVISVLFPGLPAVVGGPLGLTLGVLAILGANMSVTRWSR